MPRNACWIFVVCCVLRGWSIADPVAMAAEDVFPPGWSAVSPRAEIRPEFSYLPQGGPTRTGSLVIRHDDREGLDGWMQKTVPVTGGQFVRFHVVRKVTNVMTPRRSALVRLVWQDDAGKMVSADVSEQQIQETGNVPSAEPEHPHDGPTDADGWTTVEGVYQVPRKATRAVVELHLQWAVPANTPWGTREFHVRDPGGNVLLFDFQLPVEDLQC